jgi:hypothetical protein
MSGTASYGELLLVCCFLVPFSFLAFLLVLALVLDAVPRFFKSGPRSSLTRNPQSVAVLLMKGWPAIEMMKETPRVQICRPNFGRMELLIPKNSAFQAENIATVRSIVG